MNEFDKSYKKDVPAVNKRRNFLKKTATGAVIVSLPAKSVWGTCSVSGAMSGNLSQNANQQNCNLPDFYNGRSPGNWKTWSNNMHDTFLSLKAQRQALGHQSSAYADEQACYSTAIEDAMNHTMELPQELNAMTMTVGDGLLSGGTGMNNIYFHLAAVYLNAFFEFYDGYGGRNSALDAIKQVYLYWYVNRNSPLGMSISNSDLGYTDGQTNWSPANCINN